MLEKKRTLQEQIKRMKKLALITEDNGIKPSDVNPNQPNKESEIEDIINNPQFDQEMDKAMQMFAKDLPNEISQLANTVGDKDGQIEIEGNDLTTEGKLNEAGLIGLTISAFLAAPKLAELLGDALAKSGTNLDRTSIQKAGEKLSRLGHKWHKNYLNVIKKIITPFTKTLDETDRQKFAEKILMSAILIAGVNSLTAATAAGQAGNIGLSALEGGLGGVKALEIVQAMKGNFPKWIASALKFGIK